MSKDIKFDFTGMNFVLTGASSGIGRQLAIELLEAGANVLGIARRADLLQELAVSYPGFVAAPCDVRDKVTMETFIQGFVERCGKLNGSVHVAGVSETTSIKSMLEEVNSSIMDVNFWGGMNLLNITTKKKISLEGASHVLFASIRAHTGAKGLYAYSAAKAASRLAAKSIAKEIAARRQRVNTISPGWVKSDMTMLLPEITDVTQLEEAHLLGIGTETDVTGVVMFLLSSRASWITGSDILVDGGCLS